MNDVFAQAMIQIHYSKTAQTMIQKFFGHKKEKLRSTSSPSFCDYMLCFFVMFCRWLFFYVGHI